MARTYRDWADDERFVPVDAETAYDLYLESFEHESRSEFERGNHDYADYESYLAAEPPTDWAEFYEQWRVEDEDRQRDSRR